MSRIQVLLPGMNSPVLGAEGVAAIGEHIQGAFEVPPLRAQGKVPMVFSQLSQLAPEVFNYHQAWVRGGVDYPMPMTGTRPDRETFRAEATRALSTVSASLHEDGQGVMTPPTVFIEDFQRIPRVHKRPVLAPLRQVSTGAVGAIVGGSAYFGVDALLFALPSVWGPILGGLGGLTALALDAVVSLGANQTVRETWDALQGSTVLHHPMKGTLWVNASSEGASHWQDVLGWRLALMAAVSENVLRSKGKPFAFPDFLIKDALSYGFGVVAGLELGAQFLLASPDYEEPGAIQAYINQMRFELSLAAYLIGMNFDYAFYQQPVSGYERDLDLDRVHQALEEALPFEATVDLRQRLASRRGILTTIGAGLFLGTISRNQIPSESLLRYYLGGSEDALAQVLNLSPWDVQSLLGRETAPDPGEDF